jgi:hypothetical protein
MVDVKQAIYNTIYNLLDALDDERSVSEKMKWLLADLKEDFPEIYSSVLETRYCERHDI